MVNGAWEVRFFTKFGPPPHEVSVLVDMSSGQVLKVIAMREQCLQEPTPTEILIPLHALQEL